MNKKENINQSDANDLKQGVWEIWIGGKIIDKRNYKNGKMNGLCLIYNEPPYPSIIFYCIEDIQEGEDIEYIY